MALTKNRVVLAKLESSYGTDPTPTGGSNAISVTGLKLTPVQADYVSRNLLRTTRGTDAMPVANEYVAADLSFEVAGADSTATTVASYAPLLRACGLAETVGGSDVQYDPVSSGEESVTLYVNRDGTRHPITGVRGNMSFELEAGAVPQFRLQMSGLWNDPSAQSMPTPTYGSIADGIVANSTNTPTFTLHGVSGLSLVSLSFDLGNDLQVNRYIGTNKVELVDHAISGQVTIEAPAMATKNFFTACQGGDTGALALQHGTATGNTVLVDAPKVQLTNPRYVDLDGTLGLQMDMMFHRDSGDDDVKITTK